MNQSKFKLDVGEVGQPNTSEVGCQNPWKVFHTKPQVGISKCKLPLDVNVSVNGCLSSTYAIRCNKMVPHLGCTPSLT